MKATPYRTIRDGIVSRMGIDPAQTLLPSQAAAIAEYTTTAAAMAWEYFDWTEINHIEERIVIGAGFAEGGYTYESDYVGTIAYIGRAIEGSTFEQEVWRIKRVTTTAAGEVINIDTALNVAWNNRLTATYVEDSQNSTEIPYVPLYSEGKTPIGAVFAVYLSNPDTTLVTPLRVSLADDRILITDTDYTGGTVFIKFRQPVPQFTAVSYDSATAYAPGDLVYHNPTGDCYRALLATTGNAPTNPAFWLRHRIPAILADYLKFYAIAETLAEDGQYDKSQFQFLRAEGVLQQRMDDAWLRKGEVRRYSAAFS